MSDIEVVPELSELIGSMIFCSERAVSAREIRRCLQEVAESQGGAAAPFREVTGKDVRTAVKTYGEALEKTRCGFHVVEVAGGYRLQSDSRCGAWVRHLLKREKPHRLSRPALETLAIVAYRQPVSRAEIEEVRGVAVGHLVKSLMEMQLVRITGRSEMPGRPFLYGTTTTFLIHFGLKTVEELKQIDPSLVLAEDQKPKRKSESKGPEEPVLEQEQSEQQPDEESSDG